MQTTQPPTSNPLTLAMLQQAVQHLTTEERKSLHDWMEEYEAQQIDDWLEKAVLAGEFEAMAEKARADFRAGLCTPI